MSNDTEIKKPVIRHTNISKVVVKLDGKRYRFNLTRRGVVIRRWHAQNTKTISFSQLLDLSLYQRQML